MTMPARDAWTYSNSPGLSSDPSANALDTVRFYTQDTDPAFRLLSDNEVAFCILEWVGVQDPTTGAWNGPYDHLLMAAHACCLRIAAKFAGATTVDADGVEVDLSSLQNKYKQLASDILNEYEVLSEPDADVDYANLLQGSSVDPSIAPLNFAIGMHDNPDAGQQNYGGQYGAMEFDEVSPGIELEEHL